MRFLEFVFTLLQAETNLSQSAECVLHTSIRASTFISDSVLVELAHKFCNKAFGLPLFIALPAHPHTPVPCYVGRDPAQLKHEPP